MTPFERRSMRGRHRARTRASKGAALKPAIVVLFDIPSWAAAYGDRP
jgi:hypothetical protein